MEGLQIELSLDSLKYYFYCMKGNKFEGTKVVDLVSNQYELSRHSIPGGFRYSLKPCNEDFICETQSDDEEFAIIDVLEKFKNKEC